MYIKQGIPEDRKLEALKWGFEYFKHVIDGDYFYHLVDKETNWEISLMLVDDNDKIKGLYLFGDSQISSIIKLSEYKNLSGIEGILLAVDGSIRGNGWGNKLKDYPKTMNVDYIWGQQLKTLNNLDDWLKRRILVTETQHVYITLELFSK